MASYDDTATVSGSVVSFSDGADEVGLKSCVISLPASLTGYSEVNAVRSGKNLYDVDGAVYNGDFYDASGNVVRYADCAVSWIRVNPSTKYAFSCTKETSQTVNVRIAWCKSDKSFISRQGLFSDNQFPMTLTTPSNCEWVQLSVNQYGAALIAQNNWSIQVEQNDTASTFEAYDGEQYTASLGCTIYGGQADIVTGEGEDYGLWVNMSDIAWTEDPNRLGVFYGTVAGRKTATADDPSPVIGCTCYDVNNVNVTTGIDKYISGARSYGGNIIFFRDSALAGYTRAQVQEALSGEKVCVVSANPTPFTFTPVSIETSKGSNTFWSEQGDSEVTYYKDGYGTTSVTIHKETPDGEPVEETRKLHRIIYEGQVDVISGTGLIYRGESGTQYDPPEQISFTPIEVSTDEGENTLYADEGDSAITYRKAVD